MTRSILLFLLLIVLSGYSQDNAGHTLSPETALKQSETYMQKALWFIEIPQYDYDSAVYYLNQSFTQLDDQQPLHFQQLTEIYRLRSRDFREPGIKQDSVVQKGWSYASRLASSENTRIIKYRYLMDWALIKLDMGLHKQAREVFKDAVSYLHSNEAPEFQAITMLDKGYFYHRYGLPEEKKIAHQYLLKSLSYFKQLKKIEDIKSYYKVLERLSGNYVDVQPDSSYYYKFQQKPILKDIKDPRRLSVYYSTLGRDLITHPLPGTTMISPEQYEEGRKNIYKAMEIMTMYNVKNSTDIFPYCYGLLADMDVKDKKYDSAIAKYKKAYDVYLKGNHPSSAVFMLDYIGRAYYAKGDLENALKYKEQFYEESLKFEEERNERSMRESELQVNLLTQQQQLEDNKNQQKIFIGALAVGLVLLGLIFYSYRLKQKSSKRLSELNHDLESKNALLDKRNADNELLLKEIHHRVKNNLEVVSSLLALQSAQIDDVNTKEAMLEGQNRVNSIGIVHQKLYQGENLGAIEMKDYFLNLGENIIDTFGANKKIELELAMDKLNVDIDTAVPLGLIVNELLTNTLKYAFEQGQNGKVSITLEKQDNGVLHLEVADNGKGKSGVTKGTGFGSQLVELLTKQLNGIMREETIDGTRIIFDFKG